jgi:hypothetical protein
MVRLNLNFYLHLGGRIKKRYNKFISKFNKLDKWLEEYDRKNQLRYQERMNTYIENINLSNRNRKIRNQIKLYNLYNYLNRRK